MIAVAISSGLNCLIFSTGSFMQLICDVSFDIDVLGCGSVGSGKKLDGFGAGKPARWSDDHNSFLTRCKSNSLPALALGLHDLDLEEGLKPISSKQSKVLFSSKVRLPRISGLVSTSKSSKDWVMPNIA